MNFLTTLDHNLRSLFMHIEFQMIGVVSQEPCLFAGTIRENICLGRVLSDQKIEQACRTANALEFIAALDKVNDVR